MDDKDVDRDGHIDELRVNFQVTGPSMIAMI